MINFHSHKEFYKKEFFVQLIFCCVTLVMLITRYFSFYTYKGSDDLHYAFLSSSVLNGSYDMFFANDIYSARAAVVFYQALWFKLFGINDFSMCMPSLSVLIILAYLVCFKCGLQKNVRTILLAGSIIYFNPVVTRTTLGNLPDVYIALIALLVFLLIKKNTENLSIKQNLLWGIVAGLLLTAGLFVKESIVLIYAGTATILFYYRKKTSGVFVIALATVFIIGVAGYLCFYYVNTGNFFYHFVQIKNSTYFNPCSYGCQPIINLVKRLTITVPFVTVVAGAYPLLLLTSVLFTYRQRVNAGIRFWKITLLLLIVLALYFPFSVFPYIPLCHDMRQFFFIFPFASILYLFILGEAGQSANHTRSINITGSIVFVLVTLICIVYTPFNKWGIFCNSLLALVFIGNTFFYKKLKHFFLYLAVPVILWLSTVYPIIKKPHSGYPELKALQGKLMQGTNFITHTFYFLNNDTKTHFALISQFDTAMQFFNLDTVQTGFKPFISYQPQYTFQKGWLIVSGHYFENINAGTMKSVDQLLTGTGYRVKVNKTTAYFLTSEETVKQIMDILNAKTAANGCY